MSELGEAFGPLIVVGKEPIAMVWVFILGAAAIAMVASDRIWGNPVSVFGAMFLGFCFWLLVGVAMTGMGL